MVKFDQTDRICLVAGVNLTMAGLKTFIVAVTPYLTGIAVLAQAVIGVYSVYHLVFKKKKDPEV